MLAFAGLYFILLTKALVIAQDCSLNVTLNALKSPLESEFVTPHYPNGFPDNKTCGWFIKAPEGYIIELNFTESFLNFPFDSVHVYDVFDEERSDRSLINLIRFYPKIISRSRVIYILFKNNKTYAIRNQIKAIYKAFKSGKLCSSTNTAEENGNILLTSPSGIIKTPGFPKGYTDTSVRDCFWKIIAPEGKLVRVTFITFQIHVDNRVKIIDNWNWWYPWYIYRLTPWHTFTVYSTGRQLGIQFNGINGDGENHGAGFMANYTMVPAGDLSDTCELSKNTTVRMSGEGRSFSSPGYPRNPGVGTCTWNISVPQGQYVKLTFWGFEGPCYLNYAEVFDVTNATSKLLTKSCGTTLFNQQVLYSNGNNLLVRYSSAFTSKANSGFTATFEAVKYRPAMFSCIEPNNESGIRLSQNGSDFASFDYPLPYPNNAKCSWLIEAPIGHVVQLKFHTFVLQESQDCQADYVDVKEGFGSESPASIGRFCGRSLPPVLQSKYHKMYVDFESDILERYPGFRASYYFVPDPALGPCNQDGVDNIITLSGASGKIFSPRYPPFPVPQNISCTWVIAVPEGHFVKLRATGIEQDSGCSLVSIRDGRHLTSPLVTSFCKGDGFILPMTYFSSGRYLLVRYHSPSRFRWFTAEFEAVKQLPASYSCTRKRRNIDLTSPTGTLASYNYPLSYDDQGSCTWKISVGSGSFKRIALSFDVFNLSDTGPACLDYVGIGESKFDINRASTRKYCGSKKPPLFTSGRGELYVWFFASGKTRHPGFQATYKTEVSPVGVGIIVACCLGGTTLFIVIGSITFKYLKWRKRESHAGNSAREGFRQLCNEELESASL